MRVTWQIPLLLTLFSIAPLHAQTAPLTTTTTPYTADRFPTFTFDELVTLSHNEPLSQPLEAKLDSVLHAVELDNSFSQTATPLQVPQLGPAIRAAEWNIERGERFDWVVRALKGEKDYEDSVRKDNPGLDSFQLVNAVDEANVLKDASILVLNEVDLGLARSDYHAVAYDLAAALKMNFAYGVEFVEVDPLKLGTEQLTSKDTGGDEEMRQRLESELKADPARYKGLHGSAILSRYPISNVRVLRLPVCYDWFGKEVSKVSEIEAGKRLASNKIFLEKIEREVRRGGRIAIIADLDIPEIPGGKLTVVNAHLENKCQPKCRLAQMRAILAVIKEIRNPVIVSGDMNSTGSDASNLSLSYIAKTKATDYRFWGEQVVRFGTPLPSLMPLNYLKNYSDPTARDIRILANNKEAALFNNLQKFRFDDKSRFDFRGDKHWTVNNTHKRLANSNMRDRSKGFVYTFSLPRDFAGFYGRFKLDWFFIKPARTSKSNQTIVPVFPRTMLSVNKAPTERISDHSPITVDLALTTPRKKKAKP